MSKHTPGPWTISASGVVEDQHGNPIKLASAWIEDSWKYEDADEESKANANLIAAAPELLALARRVSRIGQHQAPGQRECLCGQCDMIRTAMQLVDQAEGGAA